MSWISYKNLSGNAGVTYYRIKDNSIEIRFTKNQDTHYYIYSSPPLSIDRMKLLAEEGRGLSTFITQNRKYLTCSKISL